MLNERNISASIVIYNTNIEQLRTIVNSYLPSKERFLYLIDNSKKETNLTNMNIDYNNIEYYFVGKNIGYGAGHNIAIKKAIEKNTEYHIILNPDLIFNPNIIDKIADFMDNDLDIAQVMPKIINQYGEIQYLCKLIPTPIDLFLKRFIPEYLLKKHSNKFQLKFTQYNKIMNVPYLSGCFMFFRTSAFETVGLFDEIFFMYPEDIDITRRMHKIYKTIYYPKVSVIHGHNKESYKNNKMLIIHIKNIIKYFNKWGWFFDKERSQINKKVLKELNYYKKY